MQVFRFLIQQFTPKEQAKLLWQYICSVPVIMLEDFLPWLARSLTPEEQFDLLQCMKVVIPQEELFQEVELNLYPNSILYFITISNMISVLKVVISWLEHKKQSSVGPCKMFGKEAKLYGGEISFKDILDIYPGKFHFREEKESKKAHLTARIGRQHPFDSLYIWNTAIQRGFREVLDEIYEIRSSNDLSNLCSVIVLLQFFLDVIICYR